MTGGGLGGGVAIITKRDAGAAQICVCVGMEVVVPQIAAAALQRALSPGTGDRRSPAVMARSAAVLDQKCFALFKLKAGGRCLQAILREMNGRRDLSNSRLLLYTEDDGKAWLLARLSKKIARSEKKNGVADTKILRSFYSVVGDVVLDKATHWASNQFLKTGLWSEGGALAGDTPGCGFSFRWGQGLEGSGHSYSDGVCATTSLFGLEYTRAAVNGDTHRRLPELVRQTDAMVADLEECRDGESWSFGDDKWLTTGSGKLAAQRVVKFVKRMRADTHVLLSEQARLMVNGILEPDVRGRAKGVGAAYMLAVAIRGLVACSVGNRMAGVRFLKELGPSSSTLLRESSMSLVTSLNVDSTIAEIGAMSETEVEEAILCQDLYPVFGPGYGVGVSGDRCILDLAGRQRMHPAEGIIELGGSMLPDLSKRYGDRETLFFGRTVVSKREDRTRVALVRDPIAITLAAHYPTTEVGGFEMSSLSMMLGALNLTYLSVSPEMASLYRTWIYPTVWSRLCSCSYDAVSIAHTVLFDYASRSVLSWHLAAEGSNGPVLNSAALYMATEIIGKKTGSYDGEFGCWCEALGLRRVPNTGSGIIADAPLVLSDCKVWQTENGEAIRLDESGKHLSLTRGATFDHVVGDVDCTPNPTVPPTEESVKLGGREGY